MRTGFDEIQSLADLRRTLEAQFYGEIASDYGGPRKEFFRLILIEIKEKYFDKGLRELMADEYEVIGTIFALSTLQNGKIPKFLEDVLKELVSADPPSSACIRNLRKGLDALGMHKALQNIPVLVHLFYKSRVTITFRMLTSLLKPQFSETGSNNRQYEQVVYAAFTRYLREVASGRREGISLGSVLQFVTGTDEEPVLGFVLKPCIEFVVCNSFLPTANTCINLLNLPRPSIQQDLPEDEILFKLYDYSFSNLFYGLK